MKVWYTNKLSLLVIKLVIFYRNLVVTQIERKLNNYYDKEIKSVIVGNIIVYLNFIIGRLHSNENDQINLFKRPHNLISCRAVLEPYPIGMIFILFIGNKIMLIYPYFYFGTSNNLFIYLLLHYTNHNNRLHSKHRVATEKFQLKKPQYYFAQPGNQTQDRMLINSISNHYTEVYSYLNYSHAN